MKRSVYKDKRWKQARQRALSSSGYRCRNCMRYGRAVDATTVHHANPVEERQDLRYTSWNLVPLCAKCHDAMHDRSNGELTELGEWWRARVTPPPSA